jgi:hypothetical protein
MDKHLSICPRRHAIAWVSKCMLGQASAWCLLQEVFFISHQSNCWALDEQPIMVVLGLVMLHVMELNFLNHLINLLSASPSSSFLCFTSSLYQPTNTSPSHECKNLNWSDSNFLSYCEQGLCAQGARGEVRGVWCTPIMRCKQGERGSLYEHDFGLAAIASSRGSDGSVWLSMAAVHHLYAPAQGSLGTKGGPMTRAEMMCGSRC